MFYLDTVRTFDSSRVTTFANELSYALLTRDKKFGFSAGYKYEHNYTWQKFDSTFVNHILQSDLVYRTALKPKDSLDKRKRFFETRLNLQYGLQGPNSTNYKVESNTIFTLNEPKKRYVFLNILNENISADYIFNNWVSNQFIWFNNRFKSQQQTQLDLGINFGRYLKRLYLTRSSAITCTLIRMRYRSNIMERSIILV